MKVLWFSNTPANGAEYLKEGPIGGGWLKSLDKVLQKKTELHIAFYYPKRSLPFKYGEATYHPISRKNWKFAVLLGIFWEKFIDQQDFQQYLKIINLVKPDLIHIHGTENPFGCIITKVTIPVVVSIQGCITVYNHKFLNGFSKRNLEISRFTNTRNLKEFILQKSFIRMLKEFNKMKDREQRNLRSTRFIIGRTDWDRRIMSVLSPESIYFHSDEMLRDNFYRQRWEYHKKEKLIIHTTNGNSPYKGFETICEALYELNSIPEVEVEWQIAGISEDDSIVKVTRNKLKNRFPKSGLLFLGELDENKLIRRLCDANIYVTPSHIDNSPNSLCEAMILGMPCIATYAGGTGSMLKDGEEGILIQDGDPWALTGAILELYNNPELAMQYGRNAHKRAIVRHNQERILTEIMTIYEQIVKI